MSRRLASLFALLALLTGAAVALVPATAAAATFSVDSLGDQPDDDVGDGACATEELRCTLRAALQEAGDADDRDRIEFLTPTGGVIRPASMLPTIDQPLEIASQTLDGKPATVLDGSLLAPDLTEPPDGIFWVRPPHGLFVRGTADVSVRGLVIHSFPGAQIALKQVSRATIAGNWLGVDATGELDRGREIPGRVDSAGIMADDVEDSTLGGPLPFDRNVVSGLERGILVGGHSRLVAVTGNRVGLSASGTRPLGNDRDGIAVLPLEGRRPSNVTVSSNAIAATGNGSAVGSAGSGLRVTADDTRLANNWIGFDATHKHVRAGSAATFGTDGESIFLDDAVRTVVLRNHVAASQGAAIAVTGGSDGAAISGNIVGLDDDGLKAVDSLGTSTGIDGAGVWLLDAVRVTVGGTQGGDANTIANTETGIVVAGDVREAAILENLLATDAAGDSGIADRLHAISVQPRSGVSPGPVRIAGNRIGGEPGNAIALRGGEDHVVQGNTIGVGASGRALEGTNGILVLGARDVLVGGTGAGQGNTIAAQQDAAVDVRGGATSGTRIEGNRLGLGNPGTPGESRPAYGNQFGVLVTEHPDFGAPTGVVVGGTTEGSGNRVANNSTGIRVDGPVSGTRILRNVVGLNASGSLAAPNDVGILVRDAPATVVGTAEHGNTVAGNERDGIRLHGDVGGTLVQGNRIGIRDGAIVLANGGNGLFAQDARDAVVGVPQDQPLASDCETGACNVFGPNGWSAVTVTGAQAKVVVRGNRFEDEANEPVDLGDDGHSALDERDRDDGPNGQLNAPTGVQEVYDPREDLHWITGMVESDRPEEVTVELYAQLRDGAPGTGNRRIGTVRPNFRGEFRRPVDEEDRGLRYTAVAQSREGTSEWSAGCGSIDPALGRDGDRDGLCDEWERHGIDYDQDGEPDLELPGRTDRRDLYVEFDAIEQYFGRVDPKPGKLTLRLLTEAFAKASGGGVALHWMGAGEGLAFDEEGIEGVETIDAVTRVGGLGNDVQDYRYGTHAEACDGSFGTVAERADRERCFARLGARGIAVRYVLSVNSIARTDEAQPLGLAPDNRTAVLGMGIERPEDYRWIAGPHRSCRSERSCADVQTAYTAMHELGHTLGLEHGGTENDPDENPAHLSVMSYLYDKAYHANPLDFARTDGLQLDEHDVDEQAPVVLQPADQTSGWKPTVTTFEPGGPGVPGVCLPVAIRHGEAVDLNGDGDRTDRGVHGVDDEGGDSCLRPQPQRVLTGWEEWSRLQFSTQFGYDVTEGPEAFGSERGDAVDLARARRSDLDHDGVPLIDDVCPGVADPGQADADGDGTGDACVADYVPSDLEVALDAPARIPAGSDTELRVLATEAWPFPTPSATVAVTLPAGVELVAAAGDGDYDAATGRWRTGAFAGRERRTLRLTVRAAAPGPPQRFAAELTEAAEEDVDSLPANGDPEEDDQAAQTVEAIVPAPANRAPACEPGTLDVKAGKTVRLAPACTDPDGDPLRIEVVAAPAQGTLAGLDWTAPAGWSGEAVATVRADDGRDVSAPVKLRIRVSDDTPPPCTTDCGGGDPPRPPVRRVPPRADRRAGPDASCAVSPCRPNARGEIALRWYCAGAPAGSGARCRGTVVVASCDPGGCRRAARARLRPLGSARLAGDAGRALRATVRLSAAARRTLARRGRLSVLVVLRIRRADGRSATVRRVVAISAPRGGRGR